MRYAALVVAVLALASVGPIAHAEAPNVQRAAIAKEHARLLGGVRPDVRPKIDAAARALLFDIAVYQDQQRKAPKGGAKPFDLPAAARGRVNGAGNFGLAAPSGMDIEAMALLVMLQAAQDADNDLKALTAAMAAANKAKSALKAAEADLRKTIATEGLRNEDLDRIVAAAKDGKDSLSDMTQDLQLRLQMAMDRLSKLMQILSNIEKKTSETASSIVKDMK